MKTSQDVRIGLFKSFYVFEKKRLIFVFSLILRNLSRVSMLHSPSVRSWFSRALPKRLQELSRDMVIVRIFFIYLIFF